MIVWIVIGAVCYLGLFVMAMALMKMAARGDGRFDKPVHPVHKP